MLIKMVDKIYLLSIAELLDEESGYRYVQQAKRYVDDSRRERMEGMKQLPARAACLGAGLLLQLALQETVKTDQMDHSSDFVCKAASPFCEYKVSQVLQILASGQTLLLEYTYGPQGKPYLIKYPYYFNLSHSGDYVICAISEKEIGVDIQKHKDVNVIKLAERFFSEKERAFLQNCPVALQRQHFFDLWAKKEAYGKWKGTGVMKMLDLDIEEGQQDGEFEEYKEIIGYSIVVCKGKQVPVLAQSY